MCSVLFLLLFLVAEKRDDARWFQDVGEDRDNSDVLDRVDLLAKQNHPPHHVCPVDIRCAFKKDSQMYHTRTHTHTHTHTSFYCTQVHAFTIYTFASVSLVLLFIQDILHSLSVDLPLVCPSLDDSWLMTDSLWCSLSWGDWASRAHVLQHEVQDIRGQGHPPDIQCHGVASSLVLLSPTWVLFSSSFSGLAFHNTLSIAVVVLCVVSLT